MKTPTPELLAKWRAEFEACFDAVGSETYTALEPFHYSDDLLEKRWRGYLAACQKRQEEIEKLREALEQLACLGNGDKWGNSHGNTIAQQALKATK
jgi:hypothetical protein